MQWLGLYIFFPLLVTWMKKNLAVLILFTAKNKEREFFPLSTFPTSVTSLTEEGKKEKKVLGGSLLLLVFGSNFLLLLFFFSHKGSGRTGVTLEARKGKRRRRRRRRWWWWWWRFCWLRSFLFLLFLVKLWCFPRPPRPPPPSAETSHFAQAPT